MSKKVTLATIENVTDLKEYAELAHKYLENNSAEFTTSKELIQELFNKEEYELADIKLQLIVIDSLYSTNVSKNNGAFDEIANSIKELCVVSNRVNLSVLFLQYLNIYNNAPSNKINDLFKNGYGYTKDGQENTKKAISLISKYAYFITEYKFPIYDSFVKEGMKILMKIEHENNEKLVKKFEIESSHKNFKFVEFIKRVKLINENSNICDFNKLDNLMWIVGKIRNGGFPLLLGRDNYLELLKNLFNNYSRNPISIYSSLDFQKSPITKIVLKNLEYITSDKLELLIKFSCFDLKNTKGEDAEPYIKNKDKIDEASSAIDKNEDYNTSNKIFINYKDKKVLFEFFLDKGKEMKSDKEKNNFPYFISYNSVNKEVVFLTKQKKKFKTKEND